jgi:hypothetical protein
MLDSLLAGRPPGSWEPREGMWMMLIQDIAWNQTLFPLIGDVRPDGQAASGHSCVQVGDVGWSQIRTPRKPDPELQVKV